MRRNGLRNQILAADPGLRVRDILHPEIAQRLPSAIAAVFMPMRVVWANNRSWGLSFRLGDPTVTVGHRRGDHVAGLPEAHGYSPQAAAEFLRKEVVGTLLHELGHAVVDAAPRDAVEAAASVTRGVQPPSTYEGHDVAAMSPFDLFHERMAEAIRWWLQCPWLIEQRWSEWGGAARVLVREAGKRLNDRAVRT